MTSPDILQLISVVIEIVAFIFGIAIAVYRKKVFGWLFALTFGLYVIFDLARILNAGLPEIGLSAIFLVASLSALAALWLVFQDRQTGAQKSQ